MLRTLRLRNYKGWSDQLWGEGLDLAPITMLLGPNSAGKTSIIQTPLLLKQTFESSDPQIDLYLGGQSNDLVNLGSYESMVHKHDVKNTIGIGLTLSLPTDAGGEYVVTYEAVYRRIKEAPALRSLNIQVGDVAYSATRQEKGGYRLGAPGYSHARNSAKRTYKPTSSLFFPAEALSVLGTAGEDLQEVSLQINAAIKSIAYLGPLRVHPDRAYLWTGGEPGKLGTSGEYAVNALLASINAKKRNGNDEEGGNRWLIDRVSEWLRRLGVADELILKREGKSRHYELIVKRGNLEANIMDVGFGISQVLPMVVLAFFVPRGTTIIAEQPEIHLHPRAQVGLAELMVHVSQTRDVQFIVETHSEHMFRRLQTLIVQEQLSADDCRLYFIEESNHADVECRQLQLDRYGRVRNWPSNFFGDVVGETEKQTRAMIMRMKKEEQR